MTAEIKKADDQAAKPLPLETGSDGGMRNASGEVNERKRLVAGAAAHDGEQHHERDADEGGWRDRVADGVAGRVHLAAVLHLVLDEVGGCL